MKKEEQEQRPASYYPGLHIDEDYAFKRKEWSFERLGWIVMVLLVIAALAGLFSIGPLSTTTVRDPAGTIEITYEKFQRYETGSSLAVRILPAAGEGTVGLLLQGGLTEGVKIPVMQPAPQRAVLTDGGWLLEFEADALPASIQMTIAPEVAGFLESRIGLEGQAPAVLSTFVYP